MAISAARELARSAEIRGLREDHILPTLDEPDIAMRLAVATGMAAQKAGVAQIPLGAEALATRAKQAIERAQTMIGTSVESP
jgi:malate dehydrogenase (oxaloacetate-decarboxylating)